MPREVTVDVGVIGAGPGGYHAAIRIAQLGGSVALIEKDKIGGVCLNKGCIPTKALLESAKLLTMIEKSKEFGISVEAVSADFSTVMARMKNTVTTLRKGLESTIASYDIELVKGIGVPTSPREIKVLGRDGDTERVSCQCMIIATGSNPAELKSKVDEGVITTDGALQLEELPTSVGILGGDITGIEFAYLFNILGVDVTVVEHASHILPSGDREVSLELQRLFARSNVKIVRDADVIDIDRDQNGGLSIFVRNLGKKIFVDKILITERKPDIDRHVINLGVKVEKGRVSVNEKMETNVRGVYAVGDVTGGNYAHVASTQGIVAAENIMQKETIMNYTIVPRCIYITPEVASVGLTEEQAKEQQYDVRVGRFPFAASGRARTLQEKRGFVKVVADARYGEILGVHIIGPRATDLIAEVVLAMEMEMTINELTAPVHAHPTLSEAIKEAALRAH